MQKLTRLQRRCIQDQKRQAKGMESMTTQACMIFMVRHGETEWNVERRLQGALVPGPPLNPRGAAQAASLGEHLFAEAVKFDAVYASDLLRVQETVETVLAKLGGPAAAFLPGLRERSMGSLLEGCTTSEAAQRHQRAYAALTSHRDNEAIEARQHLLRYRAFSPRQR